MASITEVVHEALRSWTGTTLGYVEDWHAYLTMNAIPLGMCNERILAFAKTFNSAINDAAAAHNYFLYNPTLLSGSFFAPLTKNLTVNTGTGSFTFTRATTATITDFEGLNKVVKSGEARFYGARRVENLFSASNVFVTQGVTTVAGSYVVSFSGTGTITFSGTATGSLVGDGVSRKSTILTTTAGTLTCTLSGGAGSITSAQCENVTGQSNTNPSEYVSNGVLSAPYHGANVDGVKYFDTTNGNTVSDGVVTEAIGSQIASSTLKGLLTEPARTNLVFPSAIGSTQITPVLTAASYTMSFKGTGSVSGVGGWIGTLAGTGVTDRVSLTVTASALAATLTVTGSITEFQFELGASASSYIPTTTVAVARNKDLCTIPTSGNFVTTQGTAYTEYTATGTIGQQSVVTIRDTFSDRIGLGQSPSSYSRCQVVSGGVASADIVTGTAPVIGTTYKQALSFTTNSALSSVNGVSGTPDTSVTVPTSLTTIDIGNDINSGGCWQGCNKNLRLYTTQLTQAQLNAMTA